MRRSSMPGFYKDTADFRLKPLTPGEQHFIGLYILFSRLAPFYVMGEGAKSWSGRGGSSYLPDFEGTDRLTHPAVKHLSIQLDTFITSRGFVRLSKADVAPLLPDDLQFHLQPSRRCATSVRHSVFLERLNARCLFLT